MSFRKLYYWHVCIVCLVMIGYAQCKLDGKWLQAP